MGKGFGGRIHATLFCCRLYFIATHSKVCSILWWDMSLENFDSEETRTCTSASVSLLFELMSKQGGGRSGVSLWDQRSWLTTEKFARKIVMISNHCNVKQFVSSYISADFGLELFMFCFPKIVSKISFEKLLLIPFPHNCFEPFLMQAIFGIPKNRFSPRPLFLVRYQWWIFKITFPWWSVSTWKPQVVFLESFWVKDGWVPIIGCLTLPTIRPCFFGF